MAAARTLYASRKLLNGADLIAWAKGQGFATTMQEKDLHVTVAYSREPFDWSEIKPDQGQIMAALGGRSLKAFGPNGDATVLAFQSPDLQARWAMLRAAGASWDFPEYQPHVTFTYERGDVSLDTIQAYPGLLTFGPEIFAEIDDSWSSNLQEKSRFARPLGIGTMTDLLVTAFEVKAAGTADTGEFEGYGSIFGRVDSHGDVVVAGAFAPGLAEMKAQGRKVAMHLEHGLADRGGERSIGSWDFVEEDSKGLHVKGRVAGMNTEKGRYRHAQIRDGALTGLSIGFRVRPGGAEFGTKAAAVSPGARRVLRNVMVEEISLTDNPSNAASLVLQVKSQGLILDPDRIRAGVSALMALHEHCLIGDVVPSAADRAEIHSHLEDLQSALAGQVAETGTKSAPTTIREVEAALRDAGCSIKQARDIAAAGFSKASLRDEAPTEAKSTVSKEAMDEFRAAWA